MQKFLLTAFAALASTAATAATVSINATDRGWYDATGLHAPANDAYITGNNFGAPLLRSFFVFDLSAIPANAQITAARIEFPFSGGLPNPGGPNGFETLGLFELSTPVATLTAGGTGLTGIYADLGDGTLLGQGDVFPFRAGDHVATFNADGIAALNDASGLYAVGGALLTLDPAASFEYIFPGTGGFRFTPTLILETEVPAPAALALFGLGLVGVALRRR